MINKEQRWFITHCKSYNKSFTIRIFPPFEIYDALLACSKCHIFENRGVCISVNNYMNTVGKKLKVIQ